ncbi:hypothetical protein [Azospirillum sp. SYSU D00513]|uniref:hypothetical protein n=1 Tax=Azospirillum sp. SYSU D00513 TaxID=2812561 RepID=UPI001A962C71|nr:hypothetical protein [Azospirillum sp. SYSU D00513]
MIRYATATAALSIVALMSSAGFAADFAAQLDQAKAASHTASREIREAVTPALNAAQSFNSLGDQEQAHGYLAFA